MTLRTFQKALSTRASVKRLPAEESPGPSASQVQLASSGTRYRASLVYLISVLDFRSARELRLVAICFVVLFSSTFTHGSDATISLTNSGSAIFANNGFTGYSLTDSTWTAQGGISLADGLMVAKPTYSFVFPPPTLVSGIREITEISVRVYGKGYSLGSARLFIEGNDEGSLAHDERWSQYSFSGSDARNLLQFVATGRPYRLNVTLDLTSSSGIDYYDLKEIVVDYSYKGVDNNSLEAYHLAMGAGEALSSFRNTVGNRWSLQQPLDKSPLLDAEMQILNGLLGHVIWSTIPLSETIKDLITFPGALEGWFSLGDILQNGFDWNGFWIGPPAVADMNSQLDSIIQALGFLGTKWQEAFGDGQIAQDEMRSINGATDEAIRAVDALHQRVFDVVNGTVLGFGGVRMKLTNPNPGVVNCAKAALQSLRPLVPFDPNTGDPLPNAYLPNLVSALKAKKFSVGPPVANRPPVLSNPRVVPPSGNTDTEFEFLVDYSDPDGDPPSEDYRDLFLSGGRVETMTLKAGTGTLAHGTYQFTTRLPVGQHGFTCLFADTSLATATTPWVSRPLVTRTGEVPVNIIIDSPRFSPDFRITYSVNGGPWMPVTVTKPELDPIFVPAGSEIALLADVNNPNFTFNEWEAYEGGTRFGGSSNSGWTIRLGPATTSVTLYARFGYTPHPYTISGTVRRSDGSLVPQGVDLVLTSSEQRLEQHSDDGAFSFAGVLGGVAVTLTPSAPGHQFAPPSAVFQNLKADRMVILTAYPSDDFAPRTTLTSMPPLVSDQSAIEFRWTGSDDVSPSGNLMFQWKLDGVDTDWSAWTSATAKTYTLTNGTYTFWLRAKDEAGNLNDAPVPYFFVVNAQPTIGSNTRISNSVWATRVRLQASNTAIGPSDRFILTTDHSPDPGQDLVPVTLHRSGTSLPVGANGIVAEQIGPLPAMINQTGRAWIVNLPAPIAAGQTAEYDVVWGRILYFGWSEFVPVWKGFPDLGPRQPPLFQDAGWREYQYLDENLCLWRLAKKARHTGASHDNAVWTFMDVISKDGPIVDETILRYSKGIPFVRGSGMPGCSDDFSEAVIFRSGQNVLFAWESRRQCYDGTTDTSSTRIEGSAFDLNLRRMRDFVGSYNEDFSLGLPHRQSSGDNFWFMGTRRAAQDQVAEAWFSILDQEGTEVRSPTVFATAPQGQYFYFSLERAIRVAANVILVWSENWETPAGRTRQAIRFQVRDQAGNLIRATQLLAGPGLSDDAVKDQEIDLYRALADRSGQLWLAYGQFVSGEAYQYFYAVLDDEGNIRTGPSQTSDRRDFVFCDRDGFLWAVDGPNFMLIAPDGSPKSSTRPSTIPLPNQQLGELAVAVQNDGYQIFDRWTPQVAEVTVPLGSKPARLHLYDLDLWRNDLHPSNLSIRVGQMLVWNSDETLTERVSLPATFLQEGPNVLVFNQTDPIGGQVLLTFPYAIQSPRLEISISEGPLQATLTLHGEPGRSYDILTSDSLAGAEQWRTVTQLHPTGSAAEWSDPDLLGRSQRFYRAIAIE